MTLKRQVLYMQCNAELLMSENGGPFRPVTWPELLASSLARVTATAVVPVVPSGAPKGSAPGAGVMIFSGDDTTLLHPGACASLLAFMLAMPRPKLLIDTREPYGKGGPNGN